VIKFCMVVEVSDIIIRANLGDDLFRALGESGVEFPTFLLTCVVVLKTLWHYRTSV